MSKTVKLLETIPANSQLHPLCDNLLDVTWCEYIMNRKDVNYYSEKAYRESLKSKEVLLKRMVATKAEWDSELEVYDDDGFEQSSHEQSSDDDYPDHEAAENRSNDGSDKKDSTEHITAPEDPMDTSPEFASDPEPTDNANTGTVK